MPRDGLLNVGVCQLPDGLLPEHPAWLDLVRRVAAERPHLLLLNELPFGPWLAREDSFSDESATASLDLHETSLRAIERLPAAVIGSRPIRAGDKLANEAFLLRDGRYAAIHHKQYFPQEAGFFEDTWFAAAKPGFDVIEHCGMRIGVLLCTELMFTEWARHYRHEGAQLIVAPRASGASMRHWHASARMAAIVSGCYVLSSNRASSAGSSAPHFGGKGFIYSPTGNLLGMTSAEQPLLTIGINLSLVADAQRRYPCNVREIGMSFSAANRSSRRGTALSAAEDVP
jgi:N-carbamoylputrescine amidase